MIEYNNSQYKTIAISRKENKFCLKVRSQCTLHTNRYFKLVGIQGGRASSIIFNRRGQINQDFF